MSVKYIKFSMALISVFTGFMSCEAKAISTGGIPGDMKKIDEFRNLVLPTVLVNSSTFALLQDNLYVSKWLNYASFNVKKAIYLFENHLAWRQTHNIDNIHLEDFSRLISEYPIFTDTVDKKGRPIVEEWLSDWNIRKAILTGQFTHLIRMFTYIMEMTQRRLYEIRAIENSSVTGVLELVNADGFNRFQHGCSECVTFLKTMSDICEQQYPGIWEDIYMINVNAIYRNVLNSIPTTFNTQEERMHFFGREIEWGSVLDRHVAKDQRSMYFGGTLERDADV